ncbi:thioredoxin family protein [Desulfurobacterium indicum]|uniref:Thiol reductase thioredoxin n=1 Tax=Desulfurobacterium indicum TaxID=1914305 RepID=A0A1R1MNH1_9BACT|nr:thioredoxin family protein [Desulfurobacterium indicum]OMH41326.1 thiol reductase thioredoxin [Desulfurobacterium indicum]
MDTAIRIFYYIARVFFFIAFLYLSFIILLRIYWGFKSKRMKGKPLPLLDGEFARLKKGKGLVYFYSPTCQPCKAMEPIIKKLVKDAKIKVVRVNVTEKPELARKFGVLATPSEILVEDGKIVKVILGPATEGDIRKGLGL